MKNSHRNAFITLAISSLLLGGTLAAGGNKATSQQTPASKTSMAHQGGKSKGGKGGKGGKGSPSHSRRGHDHRGHKGGKGQNDRERRGGKGGPMGQMSQEQRQNYMSQMLTSRITARLKQVQDSQARQWLQQAQGLASNNPHAAHSLVRAAEAVAFYVPRPALPEGVSAPQRPAERAEKLTQRIDALLAKKPTAQASALLNSAKQFSSNSQQPRQVAAALVRAAEAIIDPSSAQRGPRQERGGHGRGAKDGGAKGKADKGNKGSQQPAHKAP